MYSTGHYPASWSKGRIISLHKKGDPSDPANYRGITITSALGKLFNSILNVRLCDFLNKNNILCAEQSDFRNNHRTSDHLFILKNLMARYKRQRKSLYIAFIDFKQAFDTVCHTRLLYKLLRCGISNKFYELIKSMYSNIQVAVQDGSGKNISTFLKSLVGARQGDNLSPTLFNICINDLPKLFDDSCAPTRIGSTPFNAMLYADDLMVPRITVYDPFRAQYTIPAQITISEVDIPIRTIATCIVLGTIQLAGARDVSSPCTRKVTPVIPLTIEE